MFRVYRLTVVVLFFVAALVQKAAVLGPAKGSPNTNPRPRIDETVGFTENKGQLSGFDGQPHPEVKYQFSNSNTAIFILQNGIAFQFANKTFDEKDLKQHIGRKSVSKQNIETYRMDLVLLGANAQPQIIAEDQSSGTLNYLNLGVKNVCSYRRIIYHEVYRAIDFVVYLHNNNLKYDFILHPGADPSNIKLNYKYAEKL